jgi:hypothetical protein
MVMHVCDPSYWRSRGRKIAVKRLAGQKYKSLSEKQTVSRMTREHLKQ